MQFIALNFLRLQEGFLHKSLSLFKVLLKSINYTKVSIVLIWVLITSLSQGMDFPLQVIVKKVGQGNCIIVKMLNEQKEYDAMLVDCGSSAFNRPLSQATSPKTPRGSSEASSPRRESSIYRPQPKTPSNTTTVNIIEDIKNSLEDNTIKAIVVTHPDKDHYSFIADMLKNRDLRISKEFPLILGGAPEKYLNTSNQISHFIRENLKKVLFTAIEDGEKIENISEGKYVKKPAYYPALPAELMSKKLNFNPRFQIELLAVNSNHVTSLGDEPHITINISSKEDGSDDYNTDSLIIKITDTKTGKSIILTGDATGVTTTRLMDHASKDGQLAALLTADVLVASHHGSSSHGTNNEAWIRTVNPEFIILSTGGSYGHPTKKAYKAFHASPRLATVAPHSIYVGGITEDSIVNHITPNGIFSTLPQGDITINFPTNRKENIVINPENSTTKSFSNLKNKSLKEDKILGSSSISELHDTDNIKDIPEPKDYQTLIKELIQAEKFEPLEIDLNDHRNEFIVDVFNLKEEDIEQTKVFLAVSPHTLVGEVIAKLPQEVGIHKKEKEKEEPSEKAPQETGLLIDLKDPRNLYLLRQLKPLPSSYSISPPSSPSSSFSSSASMQPHLPIHKVSKEEFVNYLNVIVGKHGGMGEVIKKLQEKIVKDTDFITKIKKAGFQQIDRDLMSRLKRGEFEEIRQIIWPHLQNIYPDDYKEWSKPHSK